MLPSRPDPPHCNPPAVRLRQNEINDFAVIWFVSETPWALRTLKYVEDNALACKHCIKEAENGREREKRVGATTPWVWRVDCTLNLCLVDIVDWGWLIGRQELLNGAAKASADNRERHIKSDSSLKHLYLSCHLFLFFCLLLLFSRCLPISLSVALAESLI